MSRIELWDRDTVHDSPICVKSIGDLRAEASFGEVEVVCDNGTRIWLAVKQARAKLGLGFLYELRADSVFISRVFRYSPAARNQIRAGEEIVLVQGKPVVRMDEAEIRSELNAGARNGLDLSIRANGEIREVKLAEGPVYLTPDESKILGLSGPE
jgi:S1-C subfamily serine protease